MGDAALHRPAQARQEEPADDAFPFSPKANWCDGTPVTCADWRATWQIWINPANNVASRTGYEDIKSVTCKGKTGTVVFKKVYADWQTLLNARRLAGDIVTAGTGREQGVGGLDPRLDGPWKFQSWQKGVQITVVKNPKFTIAPMKLDRVVFRYIADTNARFQAMKAGEGQAMEPQAQLQIADFQKDSNFMVKAMAGYSYEHLDIQFGPKGAAALRRRTFGRQSSPGSTVRRSPRRSRQTIAPGLPDAEEPHLQDLRAGLHEALREVPLQPDEGHHAS